MSRATTFFIGALLFFSLCSASRPAPAVADNLEAGNQIKAEGVEDSCGGINEEECLMRRTLAAHLDYIYTQDHKP